MNSLLAKQLRKASRGADGTDLDTLLQLVSDHYDAIDAEREHATRAWTEVTGQFETLCCEAVESREARALLDTVAEALIVVAANGDIMHVNAQASALFGPRAELQQQRIGRLLAVAATESATLALERWAAASGAVGRVVEVEAVSADGRRFPAAVKARQTLLGTERAFMLSIRDVTQRREREQQLADDARFERIVSDICHGFVTSPHDGADEGVSDALAALCEATGAAAVRLFQFSDDAADRADLAECTHRGGHATARARCPERVLLDSELPWIGGYLRQLRGIAPMPVAALPEEAERERSWFARAAVEAFSVVPLRAGLGALGFMLLEFHDVQQPAFSHERLQLLADLFVAQLRRAQAAEHQRRLAAVLDAAPDLVALSDRAGELVYLNARGRELLGIDPSAALAGCRLSDYLVDGEDFDEAGLRSAVCDGPWTATIHLDDGDRTPLAQVTLAHRDAAGSVSFYSTTGRDISSEQAAAESLAGSERRTRLALDAARMLGWDWDVASGTVRWVGGEDLQEAWFGSAPPGSFDGVLACVHADDVGALQRAVAGALAGRDHALQTELRLCGPDDTTRWVELRALVARDGDDRPVQVAGTLSDVSARRAAVSALAEERERAMITLESIGDGVVSTDEHGLVVSVNGIAAQRLGAQADAACGRLVDELFTPVAAGTEQPEHPVLQCLREGRTVTSDGGTVVRVAGGEQLAIRYSAAPIRAEEGTIRGAVVIFQDINQERSLYQRLSYQARHDSLTGLVNRRELEHVLSARLREAWDDPAAVHALLYLDIDQFKVINDTCGHAAGDELVRRVADAVRTEVRTGDCPARIGGDEFAVLLANCPADRAQAIAEGIREKVGALRFVWQERTFHASVSVGLVTVDKRSESIAAVLSAADVACHAAKEAGRNRVYAYCGDAALLQHREMQWVSRITQACEDDRLTLYSHPIVPTADTGDRRRFELLLRMRDPYGALVPPNSFIPAAERYNLMPVIDRWVVRRALGEFAQCDGQALRYSLSVNLSGSSLSDPQFLDFLRDEVAAHALVPGGLCFEITETAAISNLDLLVRFMNDIRELGCEFALDDFGSGLSSFAYLKELPVDYLKIDRVFVRNIANDIVDHSLVAAINQAGQVMGLRTVAEGVETEQVLHKVTDAGIDFAQGFLFGRPAEIADRSVFEPRATAQVIPLVG